MERIHFKITHKGVTRRFAISRNEEDLLSALKIRVAGITGSANLPMFWKDEDSLIVLECEEDMHAAVDYAETKNKLACVTLETGVEEMKQDDESSKITVEVVTLAQSTAAFAGYPFACDGCHAYLAAANGGRYKCMVCDNYDQCAACFAKGTHPNHAFAVLRDAETRLLVSVNGQIRSAAVKHVPNCNPSFVVANYGKSVDKMNEEKREMQKEKQKEEAMVEEALKKLNNTVEEKLEYSRNEMFKINEEINDGNLAAKKTGETEEKQQDLLIKASTYTSELSRKVAAARREFQLPAGAKLCSNPDLQWRWRNANGGNHQLEHPVQKQQVSLTKEFHPKDADANQVKHSLKLGFEQTIERHQQPKEKHQQLKVDPTDPQPREQKRPEYPPTAQINPVPAFTRSAPKAPRLGSVWDGIQIPPLPVRGSAVPDWTQIPTPFPLYADPILGIGRPASKTLPQVKRAFDPVPTPPHLGPTWPGPLKYQPRHLRPSYMNGDHYMVSEDRRAHLEHLETQRRRFQANDDDGFEDSESRNDLYGDFYDTIDRREYEARRRVGAPGARHRCDRSVEGRFDDWKDYDRYKQKNPIMKVHSCARAPAQEQRKFMEKEEKDAQERAYRIDIDCMEQQRQALKHFEIARAQEQGGLMEKKLKDAEEKAYRIASQVPAHMAIGVIEVVLISLKESDDFGKEEMIDYISHFIDMAEENVWPHKPHPRIFPDVSVAYEGELIANIAVDLVKHLKQIRKVARSDKIHSRCALLIDLRLDELRRALGQLGTATGDYVDKAEKLRSILLTTTYAGGKTQGNWNEKAPGFMQSDPRRNFLEPPRVASAQPETDGLIAPLPVDSISLAAFPAVKEAAKNGFGMDKLARMVLRKLTEANVPKDYNKMVECCRHTIDAQDAISMMRC